MTESLASIHSLVSWLNSTILWGPVMLLLLVGTHIFLTIRLRFIQRFIGLGIKLSLGRDGKGEGDISHFGALATALAATIGTGNIVGVATAISLGGPGAILWMWLTGVFGIATKYGEAVLAVKYRVKTADGTMLGGPMYALERGLGLKWLAVLFSVFTAIAAFGIGNMVQANSIASSGAVSAILPPWATGLVMATLTGAVILGGIRWLARACEALVPFMAIFYIIGCVVILIFNASWLGEAVQLIVTSAFSTRAAGGGFVGATLATALRFGVARGLFSNESGLGSAPIVAAAAQTRNPVRQALVSATGTFWDTVIICALTGLVLVSSMLKHPDTMGGLTGMSLTEAAFAQIPIIGRIVLNVGLFTFVFSTILGWSYYGERAVEYLFGKIAIAPYRVLWVVAVFVGSIASLPFVWDFADAMNALMALPNLVALFALSGVIVRETREYLWEKNLDKSGE